MKVIEKVEAIKQQELTATENLEQMYQVIEEKNDDINAFVELDFERAQKVAKSIDQKIKNGEKTGKLATGRRTCFKPPTRKWRFFTGALFC